MKAWAERHPNLMVLSYVALCAVVSWYFSAVDPWWLKVIAVLAFIGLAGDVRRWYDRTGRRT